MSIGVLCNLTVSKGWEYGEVNITTSPDMNYKKLAIMFAVGVSVQLLLACFFLSIGHAPKPKDVPIGIVGPGVATQPVRKNLETDHRFQVNPYGDRDEAARAIMNRDVYGALVLEPGQSELLIASASNLQITNIIRTGAVAAMSSAKVTDLAPLPTNDSNGGSAGFMVQTLIIGAVIASIGITQTVSGITKRLRRGLAAIAAVFIYSILSAEFVIVAASWFGVGVELDYWRLLYDLSLISFAVTGTIVAMMSVMGFAGLGLSMLTFFLLGNIISGATLAPELLPEFWRVLGAHIPTGAGISLLKNDLYFDGNATGYHFLVLRLYGAIAALVILLTGGGFKQSRTTPA